MATSDKPKLYYFDARGRAEPIRLIFACTGVEFEDIRFKGFEEWTEKYKPESPLGTAPYYEEGGVKIGGSLGILRYLGDKHGRGGATPLENAFLSSLSDAIYDYGKVIYPFVHGPEEKKEDAKKEILASLPAKLKFLNGNVKGEDTFLAGKELTYPDLHLYVFHLECQEAGLGEVFKDCPQLLKVVARVGSCEKIKAYYESKK